MSRRSKIWPRKGRPGYWTTIGGKQRCLGSSREAAKKELARLQAASKPIRPGEFTVAQLVAIFLADQQRRVDRKEMSAETLETHRSYLDRWARACRRIMPDDLRVFHLDTWVESHSNWNPSTIASAITRVKVWSRWAKRKGYIEVNHLVDAMAPVALKRDACEPEDLLKLERAIECPRFLDFFMVLYDTGCRPGELKSIAAASVDWGLSTAIVRGKSGERVVGLTARALELLRRCAVANKEGSLLKAPMGGEWSPGVINYTWDRWRAIAELPETLVPYHCRHDLYRRWSAAGVSDVTIARQLGHSRQGRPHLDLLISVYSHVAAGPLAQAARAVELAQAPRSAKQRRGS